MVHSEYSYVHDLPADVAVPNGVVTPCSAGTFDDAAMTAYISSMVVCTHAAAVGRGARSRATLASTCAHTGL